MAISGLPQLNDGSGATNTDAVGSNQEVRVCEPASPLFWDDFLQHLLVQAQVGDHEFKARISFFQLLQRRSSLTPKRPYFFFQL